MDLSNLLDFWNYIVNEGDDVIVLILSVFVFIVIPVVVGTVIYILKAIALYNLAYKSGYDKPWFAFIPIANAYLEAILPMKEFSYLGFYKSYERGKAFWIFSVSLALMPFAERIISMIVGMLISVVMIIFIFLPGGTLITSLVSGVIYLIRLVIWLVIKIAKIIFKAILRIDLLELYMSMENAKLLGIISLFVGGMYPIVLLCIMKKEPKFGFDNYYTPILLQSDDDE